MKNKQYEAQIQHALNTTLSGLSTTSWQRDQFFKSATGSYKSVGKPIVKKRLSVVLIVMLALTTITLTAMAIAFLSPKEIVENIAVPVAQENMRENYTHDELKKLIAALNENGIPLDENSIIMNAFQSGHGYWKKDTIEEICKTVYGQHPETWSIEQKHWYGEIMVAIGAEKANGWLLPEEGEYTRDEAHILAAKAIEDTYGIILPVQTDDVWQVWETFSTEWNETGNIILRETAHWRIDYFHVRSQRIVYTVTFDSIGQNVEATQYSLMQDMDEKSIHDTLDLLEQREGVLDQWPVETWAEFGRLIQNKIPTSRNEWLYQHAGYQMPPDTSVSMSCAIQTARDAIGTNAQIKENVICCMSDDQPIYKICLKILDDKALAGRYHAIWCIEIDCETGSVLEKREYTYHPDDAIMMYVPFSLLNKATPFDKESETAGQDTDIVPPDAENETETGGMAYMYFLPFEKQLRLKGASNAIPSHEEYEHAIAIAEKSIITQYGSDALISLGDYRIGVIYQTLENVEGILQERWDFIFTSDPQYLSDGYRVQIYKNIENNPEDEMIVHVEHATIENG